MKRIIVVVFSLLLSSVLLSVSVGAEEFQTQVVQIGEYTFAIPLDWRLETEGDLYYAYGGNNVPYDGAYVCAAISSDFDVDMTTENVKYTLDPYIESFCGGAGIDNVKDVPDFAFSANALAHRCISGEYHNGTIDADVYTLAWADSKSIYIITYMRYGQPETEMLNDFQSITSSITAHPHEDFPVTTYKYDLARYHYLSLIVTNDSGRDVDLYVTVKYYGANGDLVGVSKDSTYAVADGTQVLFEVSNDISFETFDYEITPSENTIFAAVNDDLVLEKSVVVNKVIIGVTNTGSIPAEFVKYNVLFLKNGEVVNSGWGYVDDNDNEIKPGKTQYAENKSRLDFDDVLVFLSAKGQK